MSNRSSKFTFGAVFLVVWLVAAQPTAASSWDYDLGIYLWALGMDGSATVRGFEADVDVSFSEIFENLDMAFATHFEANKRDSNWAWFFDIFASSLSKDLKRPRGEIGLDMAYLEGAGAYNASEHLLLFAGIRYITMSTELQINPDLPIPPRPPAIRVDADQSFADLMLGGRLEKDFGKRWGFWGRADLAGFGVTDGTDLTWNLQLLGSARVAKRVRILAGYRWFDIDYENKDDNFALDVRQEGPIVALSYSFH